ncbi:MAG: chemotaxis protein CheR [Sediminibacterium sp.]
MNSKPEIFTAELEMILKLLKKQYGYDFSHYARASLLRRMQKFMQANDISSCKMMATLLSKQPEVFRHFLETITVNVTEMFRDPEFYRNIKEKVLPVLASYPSVKIWHAGCATGEEVYSMCILLHEAGLLPRTRIYATDINPVNLEKAASGVVPLQCMKDYTANYRHAGGQSDFSDYYTAMYDHVFIKKEIRSRIVFLQHNLVTDGSFNEFELIICRNVMIYFDKYLQHKVIGLFSESLSSLGFLALGMKETLLFSHVKDKFSAADANTKIFRKNE